MQIQILMQLEITKLVYEAILECLEDYEFNQIIKERQSEKSKAIRVLIDDL